ncbi:MAG: hypothetical protein K2J80_08580 [Oscillospiraceae bacterium]|nr:hypothetical protein [Oscillospiraceae bacterium]
MDKLVAFFKNVWFRRAVALISWGYTVFMVWVAWLCFAYHLEFENPTPAFVLYLFINVCAVGFFILSRKQVITQINSYILPPIVFLVTFFGFGNWYIVIPPVVVMLVMFFANTSNETLKTVLGTMYLLLFVIGIVGHIGAQQFIGNFTFLGPDLTERDPNYESLSSTGEYRLVRYLESTSDRNTMGYYVEYTGDDIELPMGIAKKVLGCKRIHTAAYTDISQNFVEWKVQKKNGKDVDVLIVDGKSVRDNPYLIEAIEKSTGSSSSKMSSSSTSSAVLSVSSSTQSSS